MEPGIAPDNQLATDLGTKHLWGHYLQQTYSLISV